MNNQAAPFDDAGVRQAFAHAIDRDAIVARLYDGLDIDEAADSLEVPLFGAYSDPDAFDRYDRDLGAVDDLMGDAGWTKDDDGMWTKDGAQAEITLLADADSGTDQLVGEIVQSQATEAGFALTFDPVDIDSLYDAIFAPDYQLFMLTNIAVDNKPISCDMMCAAGIETEAELHHDRGARGRAVPGHPRDIPRSAGTSGSRCGGAADPR